MIDEQKLNRFKKLHEDEYPIIKIGSSYYTPNDLYEEEIELPLTYEPDWELLALRLEMKYSDGRLITIHCSEGTFTPEQQIDEIRNKSKMGYRFMMTEQGLIEYLLEE